MRFLGFCALTLVVVPPVLRADETKTIQVPYRLTVPKHVLVRAKINGKGPFNFILDTGAPAVFITQKVAEKAGVKVAKDGLSSFERFEIEGGLVVANTKGRVEDLFQLEGMNGLGLSGAEIHGVIGYNVIARYRIEFDFTKDKLAWTPLDFDPKPPMGLGGKGGQGAQLEVMGQLVKMLGGVLGKKATPDVVFRGFLGVELTSANEVVTVKTVMGASPAAMAGVMPGDRLKTIQGRTVLNVEDVERLARRLKPGDEVKLEVERGGVEKTITFKTAEGL